MANPNSAVWGAPESWQFAKWLYNVGGYNPTDKKAGRPKCANFSDGGDTSASLNAGNTAGKTPINTPIDKTICPCGQDAAVSVFGKIALFKNKQRAADNAIPDKVIERTDPINWAFYSNNTAANPKQTRDRENSTQRWSPNASTSNNDNGNINPFVYYQSRSLFANIYVLGYSGWNSYNQPINSRTMTLADWKNNYNTMFITDVFIELSGITSISGDTFNYGFGQSSGHGFGVAQLDDIDGIYDYADSSYPNDQNIYLFRNHSGNGNNTVSTFYLPAYGEFENEEIRGTYFSGDGGWGVHRAIPYSANNYERIMQMVACFGIPFSDKNISQFTYTSNDVCLPVIDDNGITHGEYTRGAANANNPFYNLESVRDKDYEPGRPIDTNTYSSQTYFNPVLNLSSMCKRYVLDDAAVQQLCRDLWKISDDLIHTDPNEDFKDYDQLVLDNFLCNSPIDVIVSLDKYPINNIPTGTSSEPIKYGKATGAALGKPLNINTIFFNFSGIDIFPKFGRSFLDYSPYTTYELYIPFCGVIQIDAGDIMDHTLSVQMVMDLSTGAVTAYVMADNLCIETANGIASLNIPVSGIDSVTLNSQINNALINAKSAQMQARSTGTLTGRIGGGLKSIKESLNAKTATMQKATDTWTANLADYELTHQQLNPHKIGSASAACSWSLELTCRLMIYYPEGDAIDSSGGVSQTSPKLADLTLYGHTTGFACISSGAVSNYHGYTIGNIDTSSITGATEQERDMIKSLFARGVYLP